MRIVLVGPPGSGKGTQAEKLVERCKLSYIGTGEILRDAIRQKTPVGKLVEPLIKQGLLVPDSIVNEVVAELFRRKERPENFVMDGYPRTYSQAIAFDALLRQEKITLDGVVNLTIDEEIVVKRISGRRCCSNSACGVCYHILAKKPAVENICDRCKGPLTLRDDDREETVRRRLLEFHGKTDPLIDHYERAGLVKHISALDPVETIYSNIINSLRRNDR